MIRTQMVRLLASCAAGAAATLALIPLAGCGGNSNTGGTQIRAINAIPNGGNANVTAGPTAVATNLAFFNATLYLPTNSVTENVDFTLSDLPTTIFTPLAVPFINGSYYTDTLMGRADITNTSDPRYPTVVNTLDDRTSPQNNDTRVRVINAAPDLGPVDVSIDNPLVTPPVIPIGVNVPYKTLTAYTETLADTFTVTAYLTGTTTIVAGPENFTLLDGNIYSVVITEPTVNPPTYQLQILNDSATTENTPPPTTGG